MRKLFPPQDDRSIIDQICNEFRGTSVPDNDAGWLADILVHDDFLANTEINESTSSPLDLDRLEPLISSIENSFNNHPSRDVALIRILSIFLGFGPDYFGEQYTPNTWSLTKTSPLWVKSWSKQKININWVEGILGLISYLRQDRNAHWQEDQFISFILSNSIFTGEERQKLLSSLLDVVEIEQIKSVAEETSWGSSVFHDHKRLEYWLKYDLVAFLRAFHDRFIKERDDRIGRLAMGVYRIIGRLFDHSMKKTIVRQIDTDCLREVMLLYFQEIERRHSRFPEDRWLEKAFWMFIQPRHWFPFYGEFNGFRITEKQTEYLKSAGKILGVLKNTLSSEDYHKMQGSFDYEYYNAVLGFVRYTSGVWNALKILLINLAILEEPCVGIDLRYWDEPNRRRPPEYPWRWIPDRIAGLIHSLEEEQSHDLKLNSLRTSFAEFCLSRLKTKNNSHFMQESKSPIADDSFVEPRAIWREAYAKAVLELKTNPKGKGHHILYWVSKNDPHDDVRKAAKSAYKVLRHSPRWPDDLSPRRALFGAFWWLRQAHLIHLKVEIDQRGAQRTRSKEITWTTRRE